MRTFLPILRVRKRDGLWVCGLRRSSGGVWVIERSVTERRFPAAMSCLDTLFYCNVEQSLGFLFSYKYPFRSIPVILFFRLFWIFFSINFSIFLYISFLFLANDNISVSLELRPFRCLSQLKEIYLIVVNVLNYLFCGFHLKLHLKIWGKEATELFWNITIENNF